MTAKRAMFPLPFCLLCLLGCGGGGMQPVSGQTPPPDFRNSGFETPSIAPGTYQDAPLAGLAWTGPAQGFGIANASGLWGTGAEAGQQYAFLQSGNTSAGSDLG